MTDSPDPRNTADIDRYLNIRSASGGRFTADGERVIFITNITGIPQGWSLPSTGGWPTQMTFADDRVAAVHPSPADPSMVVFERDQGGNERNQLLAVRPDGTGVHGLVEDPRVIHRFGSFAPAGSWFTFASNRRNGVDFDLYRADVNTGSADLVTELTGWAIPGRVAPDENSCLVTLARSSMDSDALIVDLGSGVARTLTNWEEEARNYAVAYDSGGDHVFVVSDHDGDFLQAYRLDLRTGIATRFGPAGWDVTELAVEAERGALIVNEDGVSRLHLFDPATLTMGDEVPLPVGVVTGLEFEPEGSRLCLTLSGPRHNSDVWIVDTDRPAVIRLTESSTAGLEPDSFVPPELHRIDSFDGLSMPFWLYRPPADRPPVIVSVHGGPESQELPAFNPIYQYLLERGYAVVAPNVRGSAGYGRTYLSLDDTYKRMDSVADLAEVAKWVISDPDLDESRMAIMGGSYGGFMVLAALTSYPELWAAGVDIVGISNFVTFLSNTGAYRRKLREAEYGSLETDRDFLSDISPLNHVSKIDAALFIVHGANDPRVPLSEAQQIADQLRELDRPVEMLVFDDEGHGLVKLRNRMKAYGAIADFLDKHLGM